MNNFKCDRNDVKTVFANIAEIYDIHLQILNRLQEVNVSKSVSATCGEIFLTLVLISLSLFFFLIEPINFQVDKMTIYRDYCINEKTGELHLKQLKNSNPTLKHFLYVRIFQCNISFCV